MFKYQIDKNNILEIFMINIEIYKRFKLNKLN